MCCCARSPIRSAALGQPRPERSGFPEIARARAAGFNDSAEAGGTLSRRADRQARLTATCATPILQTGPAAIDYLSARTDVQFLPCGKHPDYRSNMPGAALAGRAIIPKPFDGRLLGKDFRRVRRRSRNSCCSAA